MRIPSSLLLALAFTPAHATTGDGCWQPVNVAANDVLNVRERRSATSRVVATIPPDGGPIISGGIDKLDAEARCLPHSAPRASRWCPVALYFGDTSARGFVKRRFLSPSDCP